MILRLDKRAQNIRGAKRIPAAENISAFGYLVARRDRRLMKAT